MIVYSASVSLSGLLSTASGIIALPMSCSMPARPTSRALFSSMPSWRPSDTISAHTGHRVHVGVVVVGLQARQADDGARIAPHRRGDLVDQRQALLGVESAAMRASANSDETATRDWLTSAEARCSSAPAARRRTVRRARRGHGGRGDPRGSPQRRGAAPPPAPWARGRGLGRIDPHLADATGAQLLEVGRVAQNELGLPERWSSHAPHIACRCMPKRRSSTEIFFSMACGKPAGRHPWLSARRRVT